MKKLSATAAIPAMLSALLVCVTLPSCHIITGQFGIQSGGSRETTYGGDGPESAGMVFFDRETFEREWAACKAQGETGYTVKSLTPGSGQGWWPEESILITIDELYEQLETEVASLTRKMEITGGGTKLPSDYHVISPLEKAAVEVTYDSQYHYPTRIAVKHFGYYPVCGDAHEYERDFSCKQGCKRKWSSSLDYYHFSLQPQNEQTDVKSIE